MPEGSGDKESVLCKRCVLPECQAGIHFDETGICNICRDHETASKTPAGKRPLESDLIKLLDKLAACSLSPDVEFQTLRSLYLNNPPCRMPAGWRLP